MLECLRKREAHMKVYVSILDRSGPMVSEEEHHTLLLAGLKYLNEGKSGEVRFRHDAVEGHIEGKGRISIGNVRGSSFRVDFGGGREIVYGIDSSLEELRLPVHDLVFLVRRRTSVGKTKHSLH